MTVTSDVRRFYDILGELESRMGRTRTLTACDARTGWPARGVYFFFERGEVREDGTLRVVRIGTHAVSQGSKTVLWGRLKQHRGAGKAGEVGGGSHRGSVFRRHVGEALMRSRRLAAVESWGVGSSGTRIARAAEDGHERLVSEVIGAMPFVWVAADDEPSAGSVRATIERNAIGLLAAARAAGFDPPSGGWLGQHARDAAIPASGLWNVRLVAPNYDPAFLSTLATLAKATTTQV